MHGYKFQFGAILTYIGIEMPSGERGEGEGGRRREGGGTRPREGSEAESLTFLRRILKIFCLSEMFSMVTIFFTGPNLKKITILKQGNYSCMVRKFCMGRS